jgi:hypothetical protein
MVEGDSQKYDYDSNKPKNVNMFEPGQKWWGPMGPLKKCNGSIFR